MSTFSFETITDEGKLLVSPDALNLHFTGPVVYSGAGSSPYSSYCTVTCTSRPLVFYGLGAGDSGCVMDVTQINANMWRVETLGTLDMLCFAPLTSEGPRSDYGLRILMADGRAAFDSTRCPLYLTHSIQQQFPAGTALSSMKVMHPPGVITPLVTVYASATTNGPQPPRDDDGRPLGTAGVYFLGVQDVGDGWIPTWLEYRDGTTGYPPDVTPSAVNFTILVAEGNGVE